MEQRIAVFVHAVHVGSCGQDGPEYRFAFGNRGVFPDGAHLICGCLSSDTGHSAVQNKIADAKQQRTAFLFSPAMILLMIASRGASSCNIWR